MGTLKFLLFVASLGLAAMWSIKAWSPRLRLRPVGTMAGAALVILTLGVLPSIGYITAGHRGVVTQFGAVTGKILGEGIYFVTPFVQNVTVMSVQTKAYITPSAAASNDLQEVTTKVTLNYSLDPMRVAEVYRNIGVEYETTIIVPAVQESVKASTAQFSAAELITKRTIVKERIEASLRQRLSTQGMVVDAISITDFDFSKAFNEAIEAKVTATQRALEAEQKLAQVKFEAQQKIATAQAEAQAIQMQGAALKASPEVVALRWIEKWNGQLPTYTLGNGSMPLINLNGGKPN